MGAPSFLLFLAELPELLAGSKSFREFAERTSEFLKRGLAAQHVGYWVNLEGEWTNFACAGVRDCSPPRDELARVQDLDQIRVVSGWVLLPVGGRDARQVLAIHSEESANIADTWEILRKALSSAVRSSIQMERLQRLGQVQRAVRRRAELAGQAPGAYVQEIEGVLTKQYRASAAALFLWHSRKQELADPGNPVAKVSVEIVARARQAVRARLPELNVIDPKHASNPEVRRILTLPLCVEQGAVVGILELYLSNMHVHDPLVDEHELDELSQILTQALRNIRLAKGKELSPSPGPNEFATTSLPSAPLGNERAMIGQSESIQKVKERIARVAPTNLCVLILGENGTGKEVVARMIHDASPRRQEIFLAVNCAAMSETLLESELFGHEKGAFTDASETRPGKFETASQGTLLLDEVGELSLRAQAKLLRVLEEKSVVRVGGEQVIKTDVRILAATNRDLLAMVRDKSFREDLYFRLNVVPIVLPSLRERGDDILLLARAFLEEFAQRSGREPLRLSSRAEEALLSYHWPGNVRELRNLMERLTFLHPHPIIDGNDLKFNSNQAGDSYEITAGLDLAEATRLFQIAFIQRHIALANNNITEASRLLGMHRTNLYRKMSQLKMSEGNMPELAEES